MSLLEKLLSLFAAPEPVNIEKKEAPAPATSPNTCPQCGSSLFVEITGTVRRCAQCAFQQAVAPQRAAVGVPIITKPSTAPSACLNCGGTLLQQVGPEWRCQACGWQSGTNQPTNGVPRSQSESFSGGPAKINSGGFYTALARLGLR